MRLRIVEMKRISPNLAFPIETNTDVFVDADGADSLIMRHLMVLFARGSLVEHVRGSGLFL
jgi:hypothetical protein